MARSMVRFSCVCGKTLAAEARHAGKTSTCPRCKRTIEVPRPPEARPAPEPSAPTPAGPCRHPKLDEFYAAILRARSGDLDHHDVEDGRPSIRLLLPQHRRQAIRLDVAKDEKGRELLLVESEVGTVTSFEETARALRMSRALESSRLFLDETQLLRLETRSRLEEVDEPELIRLVEEVSRRADELEEALFGIDVR